MSVVVTSTYVAVDPSTIQSRIVAPLGLRGAELLTESSEWAKAFGTLSHAWRRSPESARGPFTEIQKGVMIGARTRVQSHALICELVTIGEDCFVGHGVMFVNDTFSTGGPARGKDIGLNFAKSDGRLGHCAVCMKDGIVRVLPTLLNQAVSGALCVFDEAIVVAISVRIHPVQSGLHVRPNFGNEGNVVGTVQVGAGQHHE